MGPAWIQYIAVSFMVTTNEPLELGKLNLAPINSLLNIMIHMLTVTSMANDAKLWGYVQQI
jgi:hypothetical protein